MIVPRHVLGGVGFQAPSDTLNVAIVGAGGMGGENAQELGTENIVAVCDVDFDYVTRKVAERTTDDDGNARPEGIHWQEQYQAATRYSDFREMLDKQRDIDAVLIATPDHAHAAIAKAAMELGKHVYVQKPLTSTVAEARLLARIARETGVVTQMGNQGHSSHEARLVNEWVQAGVIGPVREVHIWTNRPIWPQGLPVPGAPAEMPDPSDWWPGSMNSRVAAAMDGGYAQPLVLDWKNYVGPIAEDVAYHPIYHPFHWRGWTAFGVGALGDMGAHLMDHPFWALDLGYPTTVESTSTPWGGPREAPVSYPVAMTAHYEFPSRGDRPPVDLHWYDGGLMPPRPEQLPPDIELEREGGVIFVGDRGLLMHETYGRNPVLFPEVLQEEAAGVAETYSRVEESHEMNWALACKGEATATSPFDYAARLTEVMLLGIVALRTGQGRKIEYDGANMRVTNVEEADQHLTREYRPGWSM
jgi:predicted dehydrogenase